MNKEQQQAIEAKVQASFDKMVKAILAGQPPREAVEDAVNSFTGEFKALMESMFYATLGAGFASAAKEGMKTGSVVLSEALYKNSIKVSANVEQVVNNHLQGFSDARKLAMELFEGYGFRDADMEPVQVKSTNTALPKYLRELLQQSPGIERDLSVKFARMQANNLSTAMLRNMYNELLDAIENAKGEAGEKLLKRKLEIAYYEKVRFFAERIARTELHRAVIDDQFKTYLADPDVEYLQVQRSGSSPVTCICSLITGRNLYGLGPGVYPKDKCPKPTFHPMCGCTITPRLDLTGRKAQEPREDADKRFLAKHSASEAGRMIGSQAKLQRVLEGAKADDVYNATQNPAYGIKYPEPGNV